MTLQDVELVMGVPSKEKLITCGAPVTQNDVARVKSTLMVRQGMEITLGYLEKVLVKDYGTKMSRKEIEAFKIAAVLYADAYFIGPKGTKAKVDQELYRYVSDPSVIGNLNWSEYVLRVLNESTKRAQAMMRQGESKATLEGCLFFWLVRSIYFWQACYMEILVPSK